MERRPCREASTRQGHRTAEKPALPAADLGIAASGAVVYAAPGRGALPFSPTPKRQLFISIQVIRRLLPLVTLSQNILPLGVPSSLLPSKPYRSEPLPPNVCRDLPLLHVVPSSGEVSHSPTGCLGASHRNAFRNKHVSLTHGTGTHRVCLSGSV